MAYAIETRASSPANALRDALDSAEMQVIQLNADNVEAFLTSLDTIKSALEELATTDIDLRPEEVRWESLQNRISSRPEMIVAAVNQVGGFTKLRAKHPPAEDYWWHLDSEVRRRRFQTVRRSIVTIGSILAVLVLIYWTVNTFFPPNPDTLLMLDATNEIEDVIVSQEWDEALKVVAATKEKLPEEAELWIWEAILYEQLGEVEQAQASLQQAQTFSEVSPALFWVVVGNKRLMVGDLEGAVAAAQNAEEADVAEPQVYFLQGGIAEIRGDFPTAVDMFEKTFSLAEEDDPQLAVIAKVRMGQLLQRGPASFDPSQSEPTAEPFSIQPEESTQPDNE